LLLLAILFLASASHNALGQIYIDGKDVGPEYTNSENITYVEVYGNAIFTNVGTVETVDVYESGWAINTEEGTITTLNVHDSGRVENFAFITTLNVYDWGDVSYFGTITTLNINNSGTVYSLSGFITTLNVYDSGRVVDIIGSTITTLNVHDNGWVMMACGTITTVNVYDNGWVGNGGAITTLNVYDNGWVESGDVIETASLFGGEIVNIGIIEQLTYYSGTYNGVLWWYEEDEQDYWLEGSIGTLIIAGDSTGITGAQWGSIGTLVFDGNGEGVVSVLVIDAFSFDGIQADMVDLTDGQISLDASALDDEDYDSLLADGFYLSDLFQGAEVTEIAGLSSLQIVGPDGATSIVSNYEVMSGWKVDTITGQVTYVPDNDPVLERVIPSAFVKKLTGNRNDLTITVTEYYSNGAIETLVKTFSINNNAAGTYQVGPYKVYVDTKGNDQIRACYMVTEP